MGATSQMNGMLVTPWGGALEALDHPVQELAPRRRSRSLWRVRSSGQTSAMATTSFGCRTTAVTSRPSASAALQCLLGSPPLDWSPSAGAALVARVPPDAIRAAVVVAWSQPAVPQCGMVASARWVASVARDAAVSRAAAMVAWLLLALGSLVAWSPRTTAERMVDN
jgi:hypothetical protein